MKATTFWLIYSGKREYKLTEAQFEWMKKENQEKGQTTFWFDKFVISLPHVSSMDKVTEVIQGVPELPEVSPEEQARVSKMIADIKANKVKIKGF